MDIDIINTLSVEVDLNIDIADFPPLKDDFYVDICRHPVSWECGHSNGRHPFLWRYGSICNRHPFSWRHGYKLLQSSYLEELDTDMMDFLSLVDMDTDFADFLFPFHLGCVYLTLSLYFISQDPGGTFWRLLNYLVNECKCSVNTGEKARYYISFMYWEKKFTLLFRI